LRARDRGTNEQAYQTQSGNLAGFHTGPLILLRSG
jgi:hypothetical protein